MSKQDIGESIVIIERLRFVESELFRLLSAYGVTTLEEMDQQIQKGELSEEAVGEDLFAFDTLLSEKKELEKQLDQYAIKKGSAWESLQKLLGLPRLNFRT